MPSVTLDDIPLKDAVYYSARDADATCRIDGPLSRKHADMGLAQVEEIDLGAIPMFERMQSNGILIDRKHFEDFGALLAVEMRRIEREAWALAGEEFSLSSSDQVAYILYGKLGLKTKRLTKSRTKESTDEKSLQSLRSEHSIIHLLLAHREMSKLRGTYAESLPRLAESDGRIRANFRVTRIPTGRLAVSNPNLLAQPTFTDLGREIRRGFVAPPGCVLGTWDLDQVEMRVMADRSQDETLCQIFRGGEDIHDQTASKMFGIPIGRLDKMRHRLPAKRVGFGIINGITGKGLSEQFTLAVEQGAEPHSEGESNDMIRAWFEIYPGVRKYMRRVADETRRYGYVRDMWGRIRYLPNIYSAKPWEREEAERQAVNHTIQGGAQGILKKGMAAIWEWMKDHTVHRTATTLPMIVVEPLLQVHDELLFEITDHEEIRNLTAATFTQLLCGAVTLSVPIGAHNAFGPSWGDLEK